MSRTVTPQELLTLLQRPEQVLVLDVRKPHDFEADPHMIPGAERRLPDRIEDWLDALLEAPAIIVYCVHGHAVSHGVLDRLCAAGHNACLLEGGIEAWKQAGGATVPAQR